MNLELFPIHVSGWTKGRANLLGGEFCYRRNLIRTTSSAPESTIFGPGEFAHEFTHFLQHCSTPYGCFLEELNFRRVALTQELLKCYEGTVLTPAYSWARAFRERPETCPAVKDHRSFEALIARFIRPWSATLFLEQILEGFDCPEVRTAEPNRAAVALALCEHGLEAIVSGADDTAGEPSTPVDLVGWNAIKWACPLVPYAETENSDAMLYPFGALHIFEGVAQLSEGLDSAFDSPRVQEYLLAIGDVVLRFAESCRLSGEETQNHWHATFLALADLALFTPLGNIYGHLRKGSTCWSDLHPGYRFRRALDTVARERAWISTRDDAEEVGNMVCDKLGWPRPQQFLEIGAGLDERTVLRRHRDACRVRLSNFMAFYKPEWARSADSPVADFCREHLPMVGYDKYGTVCGFPEGEEGPNVPLQQVRNCFLGQLAWNVMGNDEGIQGEFFPQDLRFDLYFTNIESLDAFWKLFEQSHPWVARGRFDLLRHFC